ncbi:hypothetical protein DQP55_13625 [Mycolicibacterium sp. GF69]|nr:hypothetical protein DQP55_13625 [Mycolicibacterium sp. GF69]
MVQLPLTTDPAATEGYQRRRIRITPTMTAIAPSRLPKPLVTRHFDADSNIVSKAARHADEEVCELVLTDSR